MNSSLPAPGNIKAVGRDCSAEVTWDPVEKAAGYKLFVYKVRNPDEPIKTYRVKDCRKTAAELMNGNAYLISLCAVSYLGKYEMQGEMSEKIRVVPVSKNLKAQRAISLPAGGTVQLKWELDNRTPKAAFQSDNENIATVSATGLVTAVSKGVTHITITASGAEFRTRVSVDREFKPARGKTVLMFAGNIFCSAKHQQLAEKYSYDFGSALYSVKEALSPADVSFGVLGTACCDSAAYEYELPALPSGAANKNSPTTFLSAVADAGFDGLVTANSYCCSNGRKGLMSTVSAMTSLGMNNLGTLGANPVFRSVRGIRFAFIAASHIDPPDAAPDKDAAKRAVIGQFSRESFQSTVKTARQKGAEYVVVIRCRSSEGEEVVKGMSEEAQFIADSGADLIVGTYPTGVRRFRYIEAADGRKVPCAFSLGDLLCCGPKKRTGIILRAVLTKDENNVISTDFSYIPFHSEDKPFGAEAKPLYPCCSESGKTALADIEETLGKDISLTGRKPRVLINGSLILERVFSTDKRFKIDKTGLLISPLAVCGTPDYEFSEKDGGYSRVDICKTLPEHIETTSPDFIAVDFYSAAGLSSYRLRDNLFTGTKTFTKSVFYMMNKDSLERLRPPISEDVWKPHLREYAEMLLKTMPSERIVLFRHRFSGKALRDGNIRSTMVSPWLNSSISAMEEYFMDLVSPSVVDVSTGYFTAGSQLSEFESEYFADAYRAFCGIALDGRRHEYLNDTELRFNRLLARYDSINSRGHFDWLVQFDSASDQIIAYTSKQFAAANSERLLRLKKAGHSDLSCVRDFFEDDMCAEPLVNAAEMIRAVLDGDISKPYEFFRPAFEGRFNILKKMATLLSEEIGMPVDESDAELVFMLRGKPQLQKYTAKIIATTVDVWGSSVSRESIKLADGAHIGNQIYMQPPVLAYDEAVQTQFTDDLKQFGGSLRKRMYMTNALMRTGLDVIKESKSRWLLIDLFDLINVMADYDGDLFEVDESAVKTGFYKSIKDECSECMLQDALGEEECISRLDRFAADMLYKYDDNIILIRSEPKKRRDHSEEELAAIEKNKTFLKQCEESFISGTRCYVINIAERFDEAEQVSSRISHTTHYESEFYRQCGRCITEIVRGTDKKVFNTIDETYALMRSLKTVPKPKAKPKAKK